MRKGSRIERGNRRGRSTGRRKKKWMTKIKGRRAEDEDATTQLCDYTVCRSKQVNITLSWPQHQLITVNTTG